MGSIRKRGNGTWLADSVARGERLRRTFSTYAAAEEWLAREEAGLAKHSTPLHPLTVRDVLQRYHRTRCAGIATSRRGVVKEDTLRNDREVLKAIQWTGLGAVPIAALCMESIRKHCEQRSRNGCSAIGFARDLRTLKAALRWAERTGVCKMPPVELYGLSSVRDDVEPKTLTPADQARLLAVCDVQLRTIAALCLWAGLRRGEVLTLEVRDVDLEDGLVHVRGKTLEDGKRWTPKSKQRRAVPISKRLREQLEEYLRAERPAVWLFVRGSDGGRLRSVEDRVRKAYQRAGLEPLGLHVLRKTFASTLARNGTNAEVIRRLGGWSSLEVVQRSYFGLDLDALRSAIEKAD